ncbi:MAG: hypothetical protein HY544_05480 [Candidatus Diapherotrites archaeon]|uniref:Uncharacterized protein n=1 Tax=Candidatus Iainarchaeum sp. TaxID=3101447 RepID=A0A8T3YMB4_9ARCH|nr:hypothetical protein [Candidatus Diapherotrites archaeon]
MAIFLMISSQRGNLFQARQEGFKAGLQRVSAAESGEIIKSYGYSSSRFSAAKASIKEAETGAAKRFWVEYGLGTPPQLISSKEALGLKTLDGVSNYLGKLPAADFESVRIKEGKVASVKIMIEEDDLLPEDEAGKFDDHFLAETKGSEEFQATGYAGDANSGMHDYRVGVYPNRFWYLYRVIRKWSMDDIVGGAACQLMPAVKGLGSGACCLPSIDEKAADAALEYSAKELAKRFDDKVSCSYSTLSAHAKSEVLKSGNSICKATCPEGCACTCPAIGCQYDSDDGPCPSGPCPDPYASEKGMQCVQGTVPYVPVQWQPESNCGNVNGECYGFGTRHELSFVARFECLDNKYNYPAENKFEKMKFVFYVHVYLLHEAQPDSSLCSVSCPLPPVPQPPYPQEPAPLPPIYGPGIGIPMPEPAGPITPEPLPPAPPSSNPPSIS